MRARGFVALLTVLAFATRLQLFLSSKEPTGWDGYAWVVQVERLVKEHRLHWPDASWVTYFFGALHLAVPSPVVAVKLGACLLAALVVPAAWWLGRALSPPNSIVLPATLAVWAASSPAMTHLAGDFPKSLGAVAPMLLALSWQRAVSKRTALALAAAALLGAVAHRVGAALLVVSLLGALAAAALSRMRAGRALLLVGAVALVFVVLTATLPNLLHPSDLERLTTQLSLRPRGLTPWPYFSLRKTGWPERTELLPGWPSLVVGSLLAWRRPELRVRAGALLGPLLVCLFPLWRTDVLDLGYRLSLMAPVFSVPLLALALVPARASLVRGALFLLVPAVLLARTGFDPKDTPPYAAWRALIAKIPRPLPPLLIAPQGFNFLYDHETGHESLAWSPDPGVDRASTWRLAWGIRDGEWLALAPSANPAPVRLDPEVVYVREDVWEAFKARALDDDDDDLRERVLDLRNPSKTRPASLLRNR